MGKKITKSIGSFIQWNVVSSERFYKTFNYGSLWV